MKVAQGFFRHVHRQHWGIECYHRGLIVLGAGHNTIRWSPPLVLARAHVDVALEIFDEAISAALKG